jgi:HK97 family phage prohead protease
MDRNQRLTRVITSKLETRAAPDSADMIIEGYFAVCNQQTELWPGAFEEIASGAFDKTLGNDVRALTNHEAMFVLGRNKSGTLELRADAHGLWGSITINPDDSDAVNLYQRVKRRDVDQCSFGFNILRESTDWREDGSVKWTIEEIDLHEVSVVTFPAYEATGVQARQAEVAQHQERQLQQRKQNLKARLKKNGS